MRNDRQSPFAGTAGFAFCSQNVPRAGNRTDRGELVCSGENMHIPRPKRLQRCRYTGSGVCEQKTGCCTFVHCPGKPEKAPAICAKGQDRIVRAAQRQAVQNGQKFIPVIAVNDTK